ncbi:hypothetical protein M9458_017390, partial [Cirrhinus mrigala]
GNYHRTFSTTLPITPYLRPPLPVPGFPGRFRQSAIYTSPSRAIPREVLTSFTINPERLPLFPLPTRCRPDCLFPYCRSAACLLTTRLDYRLLSLDCLYCSRLLLLTIACLTTSINVSHMDPTPPPHSMAALQKTSPTSDPATAHPVTPDSASPPTVLELTSELSAQASTLAVHQQQLDRLTDLTGQLVRALQGPATDFPACCTSRDHAHAGSNSSHRQPATRLSREQPHLYPTDEGKIAFVCSLLTGKALDWATAVWRLDRPTFPTFAAFLQQFKGVFQPSSESGEAGEEIMALRQGRRPAADYALTFRTLAAQSGWNDGPLKLHYRKGLNPELQVELACRDEGLSLEQYIDLSIRVDNVMRARKSSRFTSSLPLPTPSSEAPLEPMQLGSTKLSLEERERRLRNNLCLYCGLAGHVRASCPTRPPRQPSSVSSDKSSSNSCDISVTLECGDTIIKTTALIDSGAAGNFIDADFVANNHLPTLSCSPHVSVAALDGRPLGSGRIHHTTDDLTLHIDPSHRETIRFFIISSPRSPVILGYPWLNQHEPSISWADRTITRWSTHCHQHCQRTQVTPAGALTRHTSSSSIPTEYQDLLEAFSRTRATQLPPHRPGDCTIDLIPGATPPRGRVFPLSQAESEAMHKYIQEELAKGFITPSTSPASAGFFFVKKKDGGLRPCIDYRGLNEVTVKYRYPLPLVPSALEQLRTAKIFTKLDLRSAYNLIRIRAGDEWKTAFSTTSGHYEYRVMPFGLANSPSCFQAFVNDVFRDMLNRWVIVYIDDILIYSNSYSEHVQHVRCVLQRLISHQLFVKEEKCDFHKDKISFLGYIISSEGVAMEEKKVDAVLNWPRPNTLRELQRFLGFANFYRRFIRNFSTVAAPLSAMVKKGTTRLTWSQAALQAFDDLRRRFSTAPILHHPDPERPFVVEVDASSTGVGAVLSQRQGDPPKLYPCAYFSHKLSPAECNYDVGNRELLAMKLALEEWRHWLEGAKHPFTVLTDHKNLEYLRSAKVPRRLPAGLLQPLPVPERPWSHIAIDFVTDLPPSNGYTTILSVVDRFSKACRFIPLPKLPSALETAETLCNWVFRLYGLPEDIVSDRGPQFTSRLWSNFFRLLGVNVSLTSGYHPQANGQVERLNQELIRFLRTYCQNRQKDWSQYLFWAEYAQNSIHKPSTNLTPFQCVLGFQPPMFPWSGEPSELPAVDTWLRNSEDTWNQAHVHLQRAVRRNQTQADRRRRPNPAYEPGQWVWLSTRDLRLRQPCRKLSPRYVGPFKIIKQITPVSFRLDLPAEYRVSPTFHVSLFKPAGNPEGVEDLDETAPQGPPPVVIGGEEVYRVNTLLDSRRRRGQLQYLVDWEDYGPEERSWVAAGDILDPSLITDFHTNHPDRPGPRGRGRPRRVARRGGALSPPRSLWLPPTAASGNYHRTFSTTLPITPYLRPPLPVPGFPGRFRQSAIYTSPSRAIPREVLTSFTINPERLPLFPLPTRCRPDCLFPYCRSAACLLTTRLDYRLLSLDCLYCSHLLLLTIACLTTSINVSHMDPTPPPHSMAALHYDSWITCQLMCGYEYIT